MNNRQANYLTLDLLVSTVICLAFGIEVAAKVLIVLLVLDTLFYSINIGE